MIKKECINCAKADYKGKDRCNNIVFGCNGSFCSKETIENMELRNEMIEALKQASSNKNN